MMREVCQLFILLALWIPNTNALVGPNRPKGSLRSPVTFHSESSPFRRSLVVLEAKKKRRRRKEAPKAEAPSPAPAAPPASAAVSENISAEPVPAKTVVASAAVDVVAEKPAPAIPKEAVEAPKVESSATPPSPPSPEMDLDDEEEDDEDEDDDTAEEELSNILEVANFKFEPDDAITRGIQDDETKAGDQAADDVGVPLPDIKQALRMKQIEKEMEKLEEEQEAKRVKIKRSDKEALAKLLEQQPYADADDSFFEEEEYTSISALLGERAKPFLGIPSGPLQVGHFIGSLVIVLMAFVEYPGFPLTNLPSPLRGALQGGLATVYLINVVLAVLSAFKAMERGQPVALWVTKTLSVGGLAYDQLTQLPTLEQIEEAKAVKGKRALKNRKKK